MSLKEQLEKFKEEIIQNASNHINELAAIAETLESPNSKKLKELNAQVKSDTFKLIVVGRFKNGKSTLINTLLGKTTHPVATLENIRRESPELGPMPTDDLPCTATLTGIVYSQNPFVKVQHNDGSTEDWSLSRYLAESTLTNDEDKDKMIFGDVSQFEIGFPSSLCQAGVTLYDTPGTDEDESRTDAAIRCAETCDAAIVVYRTDAFGGKSELDFYDQEIAKKKTRTFTIVNLMNGRKPDEKLRGLVWNKIVHGRLGGEKYSSDQKFAAKDIYFIDVLSAYKGVMTNNQQLVVDSGLALFEKRLGDFLTKEKNITRIESFVDKSDTYSSELIRNIELRSEGLTRDRELLLQAYEKIQPKLANIRNKRNVLIETLDKYERRCTRDLILNAEILLTDISRNIYEGIKDEPLPTLESSSLHIANPFKQKKLMEESIELSQKFINKEIKRWGEIRVPQILEPILSEMGRDIEDELIKIERELDEIHFELTGIVKDVNVLDDSISLTNRILSGGVGAILGGPGGLLAGAGGGWKGMMGAFAAQIGAGILISVLGITSLPVAALLVLLFSVFGGGAAAAFGLEKRLKAKAAEEAGKMIIKQKETLNQPINEKFNEWFQQLKIMYLTGLENVIEQEENSINKIMKENQLQQSEKQKVILLLKNSKEIISKNRQELQSLLLKAKQRL